MGDNVEEKASTILLDDEGSKTMLRFFFRIRMEKKHNMRSVRFGMIGEAMEHSRRMTYELTSHVLVVEVFRAYYT